jgi:hypothetical protein
MDLHGESESRLGTSAIRIIDLSHRLNRWRYVMNKWHKLERSFFVDLFLQPENETHVFKCKNEQHEMRCGGLSLRCISRLLICDGIEDCENGGDETFELCEDIPVKGGDLFVGWFHWTSCHARRDHVTRMRIVSAKRHPAFRARVFLRVSLIDLLPTGPLSYDLDAIYNPTFRAISLAVDGNGVAIDCRFNGHDRLECAASLYASATQCASNVVLNRRSTRIDADPRQPDDDDEEW